MTAPTTMRDRSPFERKLIGATLTRVRELGWSQKQLSDEADVGHKYLNRVLNGRASMGVERWERVMTALGLELKVFLVQPQRKEVRREDPVHAR